MLDLFNNIQNGRSDTQTFIGDNSTSILITATPWAKPRGKSMCSIIAVGKGGFGGTGAIGSAASAAGGGGGGSGAQTVITMPLSLLPDTLYIGFSGIAGGGTTIVSVVPDLTITAAILAYAAGGGQGGNAVGGTAGGGGLGGTIATAANMPIGFGFAKVLAGQAGSAGGSLSIGSNVTIPATGLIVTGGAGGGGVSTTSGSAGGGIAGGGIFLNLNGGTGPITPSVPGGNGIDGYAQFNFLKLYGGTGGGSTNGTATGAGLVSGWGGAGMPGCGGGGSGGGLTGSTIGSRNGQNNGGPGFVIITCW